MVHGPGSLLKELVAVNLDTGNQVTRYEHGVVLGESDVASGRLLRAEVYPDAADSTDRVTFAWNRLQQRKAMRDQNGSVHEYAFDGLGRQTGDAVTTLAAGVDGAVRRIGQTYEVRGLVEKITSYKLYEYDGLHRLKKFHRGRLIDDNTAIESPTLQQGWVLDATGNWRNFTQNDQANADQTLDQQRLHNRVNEITQIARTVGENWATPEYDRNGNMTVMPNGDAPTQSFENTWDAWNRLVKVIDGASTVAQYAYDGQTWRTTTTVAGTVRHYYYTSGWQVLEERLDAATTAERQFVWDLRYIDDQVLRDRAPTGSGPLMERLYALQDANWNMDALVNTAGAVQERYSYTPYGVPTVLNPDFTAKATSSFDWETRYAGYRWEEETKLQQVRWRWLQSLLGCWLSVDPLNVVTSSTNHYLYVSSQPLSFADPLGLLRISCNCVPPFKYLDWLLGLTEGFWFETDCRGLASSCCESVCAG